ncbi:hypothetical protein Btru_007452 [Bulinus truncatus]|nr:hypothetical protein Btru_007452 [Bulinus truncatus]
MDASGYFPSDADYDDDTLSLLTSWERLLLTKRPIIAPDGYIPNSVVRRRLRFVQPEQSKSEWKLKPAPDFDPRYLPEGWKIKPNVSKNSNTVHVNIVSASDVKGRLPQSEPFRFRDDMVVVPMRNQHKNGAPRQAKFDYQTGLRKQNKVEFSLGSNMETYDTNVTSDRSRDNTLRTANVLEPEKKGDEGGQENLSELGGDTVSTHISNPVPGPLPGSEKQNEGLSKHRPESKADSMKSTTSSRKKRKSERKKKHKVRQSLELCIVEPNTSTETNEELNGATNETTEIVQRLLQENWFPLKGQHDMNIIVEEMVKLLESNEDETFTAVCQYLTQIYQLFSIAHEMKVKAQDKLCSQLKSQSTVISEMSKWTLEQLESLPGGHIPTHDMSYDISENKNVASEVQPGTSDETHSSDDPGYRLDEPQMAEEMQPEIKTTPRSHNSRNSHRSKSSAKSSFPIKSKRIKSRKDKSKRSKAQHQVHEKTSQIKNDEVLSDSEEIHRTINRHAKVNEENSSSTYQLIDNIRNGMKNEVSYDQGDDNRDWIKISTRQSSDVIRENASSSKPEEYLVKLPRMSETKMSQSEELYTDMLKISGTTDSTKNGSQPHVKAVSGDNVMDDNITDIGAMDSSSDSRVSDTFSSIDASSMDSDRDSNTQIINIGNPDGINIFHDISSEAAIVGSHIAVDLNTQSFSSMTSKSSLKTAQEAYQKTHYEKKQKEIKVTDHQSHSQKDAGFPSVGKAHDIQYAVIGAPAPQYNHLKKKSDFAAEINAEEECCHIPETCKATSQNNIWSMAQYMEVCMPFKNEQNLDDNGNNFTGPSSKISLPALPGQETSMKKELLLAFCDGLPNINKRTLKMSSLHIRDESSECFTRHTTSFQHHRGHLHCEHMRCAQNKMHKYISISKYLSNMSLSQRMSDLSFKINERSTFGNSRNSRSVYGLQN